MGAQSSRLRRRPILRGLAVSIIAGAAAAAVPASAQDFYANKTIRLVVGSGTGGGYDAYARLLARHYARHIPGNPTIVVQNQPGAGSLVLMNALANALPRDGTVIGGVQTHIGVEPIMGVTGPVSNAKYDGRRMSWIGSTAKEFPVVVVWHAAPVKTFGDLMKTEAVFGASGVATSDAVYPRVMNALIGTKIRLIDGYKGNPEMILATEQGEIMGRGGWFLSSLLSTQKKQLDDGKLKILTQVALEKHPALPNVPLVSEFLTDPSKKAQLEFALSWLPMGRPFVAPPDVPADRLKLLREGFMKAMADKDLLAEAQKMNLEIIPMSGEDIQALLERLYKTPPEVIAAVREVMLPKKK